MKEQIETLVKLQEIESDASRIQARIDQMARKAKGLDEELKASEQTIEIQSASLEELRKTYRSLESDVQINSETIKKNQDRLTTVKTNKEYQALLKGIDELQRKNNGIEEEMIALLEKIDTAEKEALAQKEAHDGLMERIRSEKEAIQAELDQNREELLRLGEERIQVAEGVQKDLLRKYEIARKLDSGPAIVAVNGTVCQGCNMNIPPQMSNELRRFEALKFCPFCNRIIYWESLE